MPSAVGGRRPAALTASGRVRRGCPLGLLCRDHPADYSAPAQRGYVALDAGLGEPVATGGVHLLLDLQRADILRHHRQLLLVLEFRLRSIVDEVVAAEGVEVVALAL